MKNNRKGFTLVELLIVIVVIGILSAMMMLSSTEAVTSAKASNIVSNLRNLKTAALSLSIDSGDLITSSTTVTTLFDLTKKYLNGGTNIPDIGQYTIVLSEGNDPTAASWFIKHTITGTEDEKAQIKTKLKGRAKSVGLLATPSSTSAEYTDGDEVYVLVR